MKRLNLFTMLSVVLFALCVSTDSYCQTGTQAPQQKPDQVIQELLSEVHQLRVAMQQMSVNAYRGQIMVERLRLQQDHVSRLTREVTSIRAEIAEMKSSEPLVKERLDDAEKKFETGVLSDIQVKQIRAQSADMKRRQEVMLEREAQLSIELDQERSNLNDLNKRLDALEREILMTGLGNDSKTTPKK